MLNPVVGARKNKIGSLLRRANRVSIRSQQNSSSNGGGWDRTQEWTVQLTQDGLSCVSYADRSGA